MKNKVLVFVLILSVIFGVFGTSYAAPNIVNRDYRDNRYHREDMDYGEYYKKSNIENIQVQGGLKDEDEIRVLIELEEDPIIEYATDRGLAVDQLEDVLFEELETSLTREQDRVLEEIRYSDLYLDIDRRFTTVLNGFSGDVTVGHAKEIEKLPGVQRVTVVSKWERPIVQMDTSKDIVKAIETWGIGYKGEGMVVSIIDTGVDYTHKDMNIITSNIKLNEDSVNALGLKGKFYTDKVPYGYNYADKSYEIRDLGVNASMHGMHVAGTVAANGELTGIAPEAQLLAMKVFGNDPENPYVFGDNLVAAIEDSVKLGADVMNLSLGSIAGFSNDEDLQQIAINRAVDNGIVMAIAAGNDYYFGGSIDREGSYPLVVNPDNSVVGAPGTAKDSLCVASYENTHMPSEALESKAGKIPYLMSGYHDPVKVFDGKEMTYLHAGSGNAPEDFDEQDFTGKIALVQRGGETFATKVTNAQNAGAVGVIVYNSAAGGDAMQGMGFGDMVPSVPTVFVGISNGMKLVELIETGDNQVTFNGEQVSALNPNAGKMSDFSSWGIAPDLGIKPEISAPGGEIFSTLNDDSYGMMSGTSMATPHVAGGSALILERVDKDFPNLHGKDRVDMAKKIMMSTSVPVYEEVLNAYSETPSPRKQGAGVMNLYGAAKTPAIITHTETDESKVALKEIGDVTRFELEVTNFGDKELNYDIYANITTDLAIDGQFLMAPQPIIDATTEELPIRVLDLAGKEIDDINVPANGTARFEVELDLTNAVDLVYWEPLHEIFPNGCFVDGFIQLVDSEEVNPNLSIPYVGFYGDWDDAPIFDYDIYGEEEPFLFATKMVTLGYENSILGLIDTDLDGEPDILDEEYIIISPNGDGIFDDAIGHITFLRNAREVEVNILDEDYRVVRKLATDWDVRKNGFGNGIYDPARAYRWGWNNDWIWDGTVFGEVIEGQYYYQVRAKIDYPGAKWHEIVMPIKVDVTPPVIKEFNYDDGIVTIEAIDETSPIYKYAVVSNRGEILYETTDNVIDLNDISKKTASLFIRAYDYARNYTEEEIVLAEDTDAPFIALETPGAYDFFNESEVYYSGYVEDVSALRYLRVNGEGADISYNIEEERYDFEGTITLPDGINVLKIEGEDIRGNFIEFERKIYVDTEAPEIEVLEADFDRVVENDVETVTMKLRASDNSYGFKVLVHGNEVFNNFNPDYSYYDEFLPTEEYIEVEVDIKEGENIIKATVIDYFGNEVEIVVGRVYRKLF